jgi:hypothetical protein
MRPFQKCATDHVRVAVGKKIWSAHRDEMSRREFAAVAHDMQDRDQTTYFYVSSGAGICRDGGTGVPVAWRTIYPVMGKARAPLPSLPESSIDSLQDGDTPGVPANGWMTHSRQVCPVDAGAQQSTGCPLKIFSRMDQESSCKRSQELDAKH